MKKLSYIVFSVIALSFVMMCRPVCAELIDGLQTSDTDSIPTDTIPTDSIPTDTIPSDTIPSDTIPNDTIPSDTIPNDTIPKDTVPKDTVPKDTVPTDTTVINPAKINAIRILLRNGRADHIAINDDSLKLRVLDGFLQFGNSAVAVQYDWNEVSSMLPLIYAFVDSAKYEGGKDNLLENPDEFESEKGDTITGLKSIVAGMLTLKCDGNTLRISGLPESSVAAIYDALGRRVAFRVAHNGVASIPVGSLSRNVYLLRAGNKSYKLILGK